MLNIDDFETEEDAFYALGARLGSPLKASEAEAEPQAEQRSESTAIVDVCDFCVIDTETTGLTAKDVAIQVAILFCDRQGNTIGAYDRLWSLPTNVRINSRAFQVHRISASKVRAEGYEAKHELARVQRLLGRVLARGRRVVAHNAAFDCRILCSIWCVWS